MGSSTDGVGTKDIIPQHYEVKYWLVWNQYNVSMWSDMSTNGLLYQLMVYQYVYACSHDIRFCTRIT